MARGFLPPADCEALRRSAAAGQLPHLPYDNAVLVDTHRLWPLLAVVAAGATFDAWHGAGAAMTVTPDALVAAAGPALAKWAALVGGMLAAALGGMRLLVGGCVFTGGLVAVGWCMVMLPATHTTGCNELMQCCVPPANAATTLPPASCRHQVDRSGRGPGAPCRARPVALPGGHLRAAGDPS